MSRIIGEQISNMPWQERNDTAGPVWRYDKNPIIGRHASVVARSGLI